MLIYSSCSNGAGSEPVIILAQCEDTHYAFIYTSDTVTAWFHARDPTCCLLWRNKVMMIMMMMMMMMVDV